MHINWKKEIFTIPNLLSLFRLVLIPVYISLYLNASRVRHYCLAGSVLAVSCLTDAADGIIARKYNMISNLGKLLDPLADKCTQFALCLCLAARYSSWKPLLVLLVVKEIFQLIAAIASLYHGKALGGALTAGKLSTAFLFVSLILLVMMPRINRWLVDILAALNAVFLSFSFLRYFQAYYGKHKKLEDFHMGP